MAEPKNTVKVILMRHGETYFNKQNSDLAARKNEPGMTQEMFLKLREELSVSQSDLLLNTRLTEAGLSQCKAAGKTLAEKYPSLKVARISPLRRVIQTFEGCMEDHPNWGKLDICFNENLREVLWSNGDMAVWHEGCDKSIRHPEKYDWGFLGKYEDPKFWFLQNCTLEKYNEAMKVFATFPENATNTEKLTRWLAYVFETYEPEEFETYKHCYLRVDKAKDQIRKLVIDNELKDGELLIVAHGNTIKNWTATGLNENWKCVEGMTKCGNCQIVEYELDLEGSKVVLPEKVALPVFPELKFE